MGKKATKLEQATRIETVRQLILSGVEHTRIVQQVSAQWKMTERQGWRYLSQAQDRIIAATLPTREYMLAEHVSVRRSIRERARAAKDLRAELAAVQDEAKLFGLYAPTQVEVRDWREQAKAEGIDPDGLVEELYAKVAVKDDGANL